MGSAVPKVFGHSAKNVPCRGDLLARVTGVLLAHRVSTSIKTILVGRQSVWGSVDK